MALGDRRIPPGNRLEALSGDRRGQHSIRINRQWRICFVWIDDDSAAEVLEPIHPGEILKEEFLDPLGVTQYRLAKDTGVPPRRINEIVHGRRSITPDTALRLARYFGMSPEFWLDLQGHHNLERARDALGDRLEREVRPLMRPDETHSADTAAA